MSRHNQSSNHTNVWRLNLVKLVFVGLVLGLSYRLADIQVIHPDFLRNQGDARHLRKVPIVAHRGMIVDRHGEPLAISTPVFSVWMNPQEMTKDTQVVKALAKAINLDSKTISRKLKQNKNREFVYLKRRVTPAIVEKVEALNIAGVSLQREYKRYYPAGEVAAHIIGFTNVDDHGQEGLELTYNDILTGVPGLERMVRDSKGNFVEGGEQLKAAKHGESIKLSIDLRLQYLAYQSLKAAVNKHQARSGTAVILDVNTGEILAMVNQPSFNPNNRHGLKSSDFRNRAVTDLFEPGSTVKPFTVATGLKSGEFTTSTIIDTRPGYMMVSGKPIKDHRNYGQVDLATLIEKSSNVGSSKIALALKPDYFWQGFASFGLGEPTGSYFPGEALGRLPDPQSWRTLDRAILAFGYGVSTSALQLARAYTVLGNGGILRPVSFIAREEAPVGRRVFSTDIMHNVVDMMKKVIEPGGTATRAAVANYSVAGKTGTAKKAVAGGYADDRYISVFAGVIPANNPRLSMVVMVDDPQGKDYYGGLVAAPVFSEVMTGAMRILNIAPDSLPTTQLLVAQK
ncbi:MAG: penicillin-binding transpeptidase domain-containing protein [Gammaproteobacteria bacterium]|nr:penicillin-binding transpeptidase domain-containing protein [Gammaproteobacteria bacterium]